MFSPTTYDWTDKRAAYAEVNWGRIESWHPAPQAFYEVGALFDVGVYPLTLLTALFGPARHVRRAMSLAVWSLMAPNSSTVRDLKAFSSRKALRGSAVAEGDSGSGRSW